MSRRAAVARLLAVTRVRDLTEQSAETMIGGPLRQMQRLQAAMQAPAARPDASTGRTPCGRRAGAPAV